MADFLVYDATKHALKLVKGDHMFAVGGGLSEFNAQTSNDNLWIVALTRDVCVLTGSGNDYINAGFAGGRVEIDAGAGMNFITGGRGPVMFTAEAAPTATHDTIANFHLGDCFTLNGQFALNWSRTAMGATVTATQEGSAPVTATFLGISNPAAFSVAVGHGGSQFNIGMAPT